jgi:hydroxymethylpyrimidine/phosphomethylpyrimidine kinase
LLPLAGLVTPNIPEAEALTGSAITSEEHMRKAAAVIRQMGASAVLIKGGHLGESRRQKLEGSRQKERSDEDDPSVAQTSEAIDLLDNDGKVTIFRGERIRGAELHGSGCILSAAIAAGLGKGMTLENSVDTAKRFVLEVIRNSRIEAP